MPEIRFLDDGLISQIAAGEVVERPASVVKEAVENSLDAGARRIEVILEDGGKSSITVRDDGRGMSPADARLAFGRHATSKIREFSDLEGVSTLGFRGEALAAIASVAKVRLLTAAEQGEGHLVEIWGGVSQRDEPAASPVGTRLEVRSLFYNVPARLQFLKRPQTEARRCLEVVQGYALAHPEVAFRLEHEGREVLDSPRCDEDSAGHLERIAQLFGSQLASRLTEIRSSSLVGGFVGSPETSRGRRAFVFVNRRLLKDRRLLALFYRCVRNEWKTDRFPSLFLYLEVPESSVDVNVHPQKAEVRFRDEAIFGTVYNALRLAVNEARGEVEAPLEPVPEGALPPSAWEGAGGRQATFDRLVPSAGEQRVGPDVSREPGLQAPMQPSLAEVAYAPERAAHVPLSGRRRGRESLRLLGQYKGSLILLEAPDALLLIDQHVAHERILYERFRGALAGRVVESQALVEPLLLELGVTGAAAIEEQSEGLESLGFSVSALSSGTVALSRVPAILRLEEAEAMLRELGARAAGGALELGEEMVETLAASMACRSAVKMHHPLNQEEMQALVSELFQAENPWSCPHGRPVVLRMEDIDLERRFKRR